MKCWGPQTRWLKGWWEAFCKGGFRLVLLSLNNVIKQKCWPRYDIPSLHKHFILYFAGVLRWGGHMTLSPFTNCSHSFRVTTLLQPLTFFQSVRLFEYIHFLITSRCSSTSNWNLKRWTPWIQAFDLFTICILCKLQTHRRCRHGANSRRKDWLKESISKDKNITVLGTQAVEAPRIFCNVV